jgi:hypothetical protein
MSLDCFFQEDIPEHLNFFLKAFFLKPPAGWVKTASLEKNLPWFMGVYGRYIYIKFMAVPNQLIPGVAPPTSTNRIYRCCMVENCYEWPQLGITEPCQNPRVA